MESNCQNCQTLIVNNFCDNCGQKKFKKIDKKYITDEIQYTFLHANKGLFYSVKNIFLNPGKTAREFIDGNRVNHYKPLLLVFVLSGIAAFISFKIIGVNEIMADLYTDPAMSSPFMKDFTALFTTYNAFIMLLMVPIFAITTKLAFRKWGHNYYEHVVMNAYILSYYTLLSILIFPILYLVRHNSDYYFGVIMLSYLAVPFILFWFFKEFYNDREVMEIVLRVIYSLLFLGIIFIIMMLMMVIAGILGAMFYGPEIVKYVQPSGAVK